MIARLAERAARRWARRSWRTCRGLALNLSRPSRPTPAPILDRGIGKIVAVRLDRLGDLVLTLPAIDALAEARPGADLVVVVRAALAPLVEGRRGVARVLPVAPGEGERALADRLAQLDADLAVCFSSPDDLTAARALAAAGIRIRVGLAGGGHEAFMTHPVLPPTEPLSLPALNSLLVTEAVGRSGDALPVLELAPEEHRTAECMLRSQGAPAEGFRIAVHAGGCYPSQRWPLRHFAAAASTVAARHDGIVVVLAGPGDEDEADLLRGLLPPGAIVVPPGSLRLLAAVMSACDLLLANNSGPLHLAGAVGVPSVSVMGPTDPVRFWPQGRDQAVLRRASLPCSPCSRGRCAPHDCLVGIPPGEVVDAAEALIDRLRSSGKIGADRRSRRRAASGARAGDASREPGSIGSDASRRESRREVAHEPAGVR